VSLAECGFDGLPQDPAWAINRHALRLNQDIVDCHTIDDDARQITRDNLGPPLCRMCEGRLLSRRKATKETDVDGKG
jgi:hypothetical protein